MSRFVVAFCVRILIFFGYHVCFVTGIVARAHVIDRLVEHGHVFASCWVSRLGTLDSRTKFALLLGSEKRGRGVPKSLSHFIPFLHVSACEDQTSSDFLVGNEWYRKYDDDAFGGPIGGAHILL